MATQGHPIQEAQETRAERSAERGEAGGCLRSRLFLRLVLRLIDFEDLQYLGERADTPREIVQHLDAKNVTGIFLLPSSPCLMVMEIFDLLFRATVGNSPSLLLRLDPFVVSNECLRIRHKIQLLIPILVVGRLPL